MELWRKVWRQGVAPQLSREQIAAMRDALRLDDERLLQGATTTPPPMMCVQDWPCEGGCLIGLSWMLTHPGATVGEVEEHFASVCRKADELLNEPAACRWWLNFWDDTPRDVARRELIGEIDLTLGDAKCTRAQETPGDLVSPRL